MSVRFLLWNKTAVNVSKQHHLRAFCYETAAGFIFFLFWKNSSVPVHKTEKDTWKGKPGNVSTINDVIVAYRLFSWRGFVFSQKRLLLESWLARFQDWKLFEMQPYLTWNDQRLSMCCLRGKREEWDPLNALSRRQPELKSFNTSTREQGVLVTSPEIFSPKTRCCRTTNKLSTACIDSSSPERAAKSGSFVTRLLLSTNAQTKSAKRVLAVITSA